MSTQDVDAYAEFGRAETFRDAPISCMLCAGETDGDITDDETGSPVCADCAGV